MIITSLIHHSQSQKKTQKISPQKTLKMQHPEMSRRFSFFGFGESSNKEEREIDKIRVTKEVELLSPILKVETDKNVYRPGDEVMITIEIQTPSVPTVSHEIKSSFERSLLIERLSFELKGVEKLDSQWFSTQKPIPASKHRRGENVFLDCSATSLVSNQIISSGASKKYVVRTVLPSSIPPSYRGTTIRYFYYVRSALSGQWLILENGHSNRDVVQNITPLEARVPLQIWVTQKGNGLMNEESQSDGIVPSQTIQADIYWKEMDEDSEWARANDLFGGEEEGYDSSRDEVSSLSSYNPSRENLHKSFSSSLSLQGSASRSFREPLHAEADEVLHNSTGDILSSSSPPNVVPSPQKRYSKSFSRGDDESGASSFIGTSESVA
ncbi:hypothetical protein RND81_11G078800 [Saponaria officinalis]